MTFDLNQFSPDEIHQLADQFESQSIDQVLTWAWDNFGPSAAIGTSFQGSGLVMIDHAVKLGLPFPVFTLDTQLHFPETIALKKRVEDFFKIQIESVFPEQSPDEQAAEHGPELWKRAPDLCCTLRKVLPLQKKLETLNVWITGLRRHQSDTRQQIAILELYHFDVLRDHYILKMNPMAAWSREAVWDYIRENKIPYNPLVDQGYRSIGCMPCTRATAADEDERAGRWIGFNKAECGIHTFLGDNI